MTEADCEALQAARAELERLFPNSPVATGEEICRSKEAARVRDWERIAQGEATPDQIQRENSPFTAEEVKSFKILNLEEVLSRMQ